MFKDFIVFVIKHLVIPVIIGVIVTGISNSIIGGWISGGISTIAAGFIGNSDNA